MSDTENISGIKMEDLKFTKAQREGLQKSQMSDWIDSHDKTTLAELSAVTGASRETITTWIEEEGYYILSTVHKF